MSLEGKAKLEDFKGQTSIRLSLSRQISIHDAHVRKGASNPTTLVQTYASVKSSFILSQLLGLRFLHILR